jgi:putative ABC transport system permease protein
MSAFLTDLRNALLALPRARGFTLVAVSTLGVGLALCVTVLTLVNAYLVRALPYPESHRLYNVQYVPPGMNFPPPGIDFPRDFEKLDWRSLEDLVELPISWDLDTFNLRGEPHARAAQGAWVTPGYVKGFGVTPSMGRGFEAADFETGRPAVALISHRMWQSHFGGDPSILGRRFEAYLNDRINEAESFTVIGVLPERFWHMNPFTEVLAPLRGPSYPYMVRLRSGVSADAAAQRIDALVRSENPALPKEWRAGLLSTHSAYVERIRPVLISLAAATGLVLLIACANVAVLLLVRATERRREVAVRKALGATGAQITRALVAEAMVLGALATAFGLMLARLILKSLAPTIEQQLARAVPGGAAALAPDWMVLLGGLAGGLLMTAVCSIAPAWALRRTPVALVLSGQKGAGVGPSQQRARSALIAAEVAACLTLLIGAALMVQSGLRILNVDMGIDERGVIVGSLTLRERAYPEPASGTNFLARVQARLLEQPGIAGVAFTTYWPLQQPPLRGLSRDASRTEATDRAAVMRVSHDYFKTLGISIRDGRGFTSEDRHGSTLTAVISESLARKLWPDGRAVGEHVRVWPPFGNTTLPPVSYEVVGVASDTRQSHTDEDLADLYASLSQQPALSHFAYVRGSGSALESERLLRGAIASVDASVPLGTARALREILDQQRAGPRFLASLLMVFALLSGLFSLIGLYGVIAYAVRQREREIALRIAIGADRKAITRLFVRQGASVLGAGLLLGIGGAQGLGQLLQSQLFGVRSADPYVISAATAAFAVCGLFAVAWPARQAAQTDPAAALRE